MNISKSTALIPYKAGTSESTHTIEFLTPIMPSPSEVIFTGGITVQESCPDSNLRDFLYALILGLSVFGCAAASLFGEIASLIITFL